MKEWPCEHIKLEEDNRIKSHKWIWHDKEGTFIDHESNKQFNGWLFCPICGAPRPSEECENCSNLKPGKSIYVSYAPGKMNKSDCAHCGKRIEFLERPSEPKTLTEALAETSIVRGDAKCGMNHLERARILAGVAIDRVIEVVDATSGIWISSDTFNPNLIFKDKLKQALRELL